MINTAPNYIKWHHGGLQCVLCVCFGMCVCATGASSVPSMCSLHVPYHLCFDLDLQTTICSHCYITCILRLYTGESMFFCTEISCLLPSSTPSLPVFVFVLFSHLIFQCLSKSSSWGYLLNICPTTLVEGQFNRFSCWYQSKNYDLHRLWNIFLRYFIFSKYNWSQYLIFENTTVISLSKAHSF